MEDIEAYIRPEMAAAIAAMDVVAAEAMRRFVSGGYTEKGYEQWRAVYRARSALHNAAFVDVLGAPAKLPKAGVG